MPARGEHQQNPFRIGAVRSREHADSVWRGLSNCSRSHFRGVERAARRHRAQGSSYGFRRWPHFPACICIRSRIERTTSLNQSWNHHAPHHARPCNRNVMLYTECTIYDILDEKKALLDQHRPLPKALVTNLDEWFRITQVCGPEMRLFSVVMSLQTVLTASSPMFQGLLHAAESLRMFA